MKKVLLCMIFVGSLVPSVLISESYHDDWQNQPFKKSGMSEQSPKQTKLRVKRSKKSNVPWYEKPEAKYIVGGAFSAFVTAYAVMNYMNIEVPQEVTIDHGTTNDQGKGDPVEVVQKNEEINREDGTTTNTMTPEVSSPASGSNYSSENWTKEDVGVVLGFCALGTFLLYSYMNS